jgi:hypothetical protein
MFLRQWILHQSKVWGHRVVISATQLDQDLLIPYGTKDLDPGDYLTSSP